MSSLPRKTNSGVCVQKQEPTIQSCFKVIESTCLARGIELRIRGSPASKDFQRFLDRHYLPFAENAIRHFFTLGFVPWRLRRLATGDCVPEAIPLGMFTWSIDSIPNRVTSRKSQPHLQKKKLGQDKEQVAAGRAFENQKEYFASKTKPYPLPHVADDSREKQPVAKREERTMKKEDDKQEDDQQPSAAKRQKRSVQSNTPAYYRQQEALRRQLAAHPRPADDEETKMLRYSITFTENCGVTEDDIEIYEFMQPTNSVTRCSVLYGSVPSPLAHILVDYRNIRQTLMRQAYADAYNTQASKNVCL